MNRTRNKLSILSLLLISFVVLIAASGASSEEYISFNGKFKIDLPDNWVRADYRTVDYWLAQYGADRSAFKYEAVFTPHEESFTKDNYLILSIDLIGPRTQNGIDSIFESLGGVFGDDKKYAPVGNLMSNMSSKEPSYNKETKTITVLSDITQDQEGFKKNLLVMKFYDQGIANFYFYSPDSMYEESKSIFADIVESFSTENLEAAATTDVKVADLKEEEDDSSSMIPIWISLGVVLIIVISRRRKKRQAQK